MAQETLNKKCPLVLVIRDISIKAFIVLFLTNLSLRHESLSILIKVMFIKGSFVSFIIKTRPKSNV